MFKVEGTKLILYSYLYFSSSIFQNYFYFSKKEKMDWKLLLLDIIKYAVPLIILAATVIYLFYTFTKRDQQIRLIESKVHLSKDTLLFRLQAYERLTLFCERIHPASLINRVSQPNMSAKDLQYALVATIHAELEHNFTQQLYVSADAWNLIVSAKNEIAKMINLMGNNVTADTSARQFSEMIIMGIENSGQTLPSQIALDFLKSEAKDLL